MKNFHEAETSRLSCAGLYRWVYNFFYWFYWLDLSQYILIIVFSVLLFSTLYLIEVTTFNFVAYAVSVNETIELTMWGGKVWKYWI